MKKLLRIKEKDRSSESSKRRHQNNTQNSRHQQQQQQQQQHQQTLRNKQSLDDIKSVMSSASKKTSSTVDPYVQTHIQSPVSVSMDEMHLLQSPKFPNNELSNTSLSASSSTKDFNSFKNFETSSVKSFHNRSNADNILDDISNLSSNNLNSTIIIDNSIENNTMLMNNSRDINNKTATANSKNNNNNNNNNTNNVLLSDDENELDNQISPLKKNSNTFRRGSHISTITNSTVSTNIELRKMISTDFKKLGRNIVSTKLNHRSSSSIPSTPSKSLNQYSITSLVNPDWDNSVLKNNYINKISENGESHLFRLELKGSTLNVYRLPSEYSYANNLLINLPSSAAKNSNANSILSNDFIKSATDLSLNNTKSSAMDNLLDDSETIHNENGINNNSLLNLNNDDDDNDKININNNTSNNNNNNKLELNNSVQSNSTVLLQEIDEYEKLKMKENEVLLIEKTDENNSNNNNNNNNNSNNNEYQQSSSKSFNAHKHLPLIIHDLSYQSPSCPHPKLVIDSQMGFILKGSLEAIVHTILFYPSDKIAERLIEMLPLVNNLADSLVYFMKFLDHFTNSEILKLKNIKITDMEMSMLFKRIKLFIDFSFLNFKGCFVDDEIYNLYNKLIALLLKKSLLSSFSTYFNTTDINQLLQNLHATRNSLLNLVSFQLDKDPQKLVEIQKQDLISADDFVMLDINALAHEIHAIDLHFMKYWSPKLDRSLLFSRLETIEYSFNYWRFNPLQFIPQLHTHYLGRLLSYHLFEDKLTSKSSIKRAQVLMKWIHLGSLLCERGDMVSWLGIAIVICSQPVLRLSETWSHVGTSYLQKIRRKWAPVVFEVRKTELFSPSNYSNDNFNDEQNNKIDDKSIGDNNLNTKLNIRIMVPNGIGESYAREDAIPYFGELFTIETTNLKNAIVKDSTDLFETNFIKFYSSYLEIIDWNLKQWEVYFGKISNQTNVDSEFSSYYESNDNNNIDLSMIQGSKDISILNILKTAISYNSQNGLFPINNLMPLSISVETPYVGRFAKFHGISRSPLFLGSYASILFPEILPHYQIYDQKQLIGAIGGSNIIDSKEIKHKNRNMFLKHVRDLFNVGSEEFRLFDDTIIFKTSEPLITKVEENNEISKDGKKSRPTSILFEDSIKSKHVSNLATKNLEDYIKSYQAYLKNAIETEISSTDISRLPSDSIQTNLDRSINGAENKNEDLNFTELLNHRIVDIITTAATPDRLIDLLVLTASVFGMHIKMQDIRNYSEKTRIDGPILLQMNDTAFTCTFFATYRVFYTTKQLINALHKRFDGSKSAALSIANFMNNENSSLDSNDIGIFPKWDDEILDDDESTWKKINWKFVLQIQLGVIETTLILVSDCFKHFMDDISTKSRFDTFLEMMDVAIVSEWPKILKWLKINSPDLVKDVIDVYKSLQSAYKQVRNICIRKSYTPICEPIELDFTDELEVIPDEAKLPGSIDIHEIVSFVNKLDHTIKAVILPIRTEDWIDAFEILQMLITSSPLSMFNYDYQDPKTHQSLIKISNIYDWIMTLNDSNRSDVAKNGKIISQLPPTIRSVLKLYERIQKYILLQIIDPEITIDERIERMCTLLKIIQISRTIMKNVELFDNASISNSPYIPSLIESVIINTITLPQSRFYSHAWKLAISVWNPNYVDESIFENLETMLPVLSDYENKIIQNESLLSICPGWILGRLVEIACFIPNMDVDNTSLINFDKNRFVHNCVLKIFNLESNLRQNLTSPYMTKFSFLFEFQKSIPTLRTICQNSIDERHTEKLPSCSIFANHVNDQIKLLELEEKKRSLLIRQREQHNSFQPTIESNAANYHNDATMVLTKHNTTLDSFINMPETSSILESDQSYAESDVLNYTSSVTVANTTNTTSDTISGYSVQQTSQASTASGMTTDVVKTSAKKKTSGANNHPSNSGNKFKFGFFKSRPFSININNFNQPAIEKRSVKLNELPSPDKITLNTPSKARPYFSVMLKDTMIFSTYRTPNSFTIDLGNHTEYTFQTADEHEVSDWIYKLMFAKKHWFYSRVLNKQYSHYNIHLTFGAPLSFVCERDGTLIPMIVEKILSEIELRGLEEVGIYRKSASLVVVQRIKDEVNKVGDFNMENSLVFDIHNLTGCIKAFLRDLPEPLINDELVEKLSKIRDISHSETRFGVYKQVLSELPVHNYNFVERLSRHMKLIEEYKSQNRMTSYNLATIMGGSLVENCKPSTLRRAFGLMNFICEDWILHYENVF